ncbi:MAG: hypothetical protein ACLR31_21535 [Escherichia coli]
MEQSWRQVLTPAADSLEPTVATGDCQSLESGLRWPLSIQSLTERCLSSLLAQYLRDDGRINQFIAANLSGVLKREAATGWLTP